ncbi:MAG: DUF6531 domain-containing protein [Candidatus Acidiferrales bacterium]
MTHGNLVRRLLSFGTLAAVIALLFWLPRVQRASSASASTGVSPQLQQYIQYLQEFSKRRKPNTFFINTQSIFDGVQVNFVNVGRGNATFVRRDLVLPGRMPVVLSRVYDSGSQASGDFGPGWMLSAAERIEVSGGSASLFTESGTRIDFVASPGGFALARDFPSDYSQIQTAASDMLFVPMRNGTAKQFLRIGRAYRLVRVIDRNGNQLRLTYRAQALVRIENDSHAVNLVPDAQGRVTQAHDDQGRQVLYTYDAKGNLSTFTDAGGNAWNYAYAGQGQLTNVTDPQGRTILRLSYQADGRVVASNSPSGHIQFQYNDSARTTIATDRKGLTSRYRQNQEGITVRVLNPLGDETSISLDGARNVSKLFDNGVLKQSMTYDRQHRLLSRQAVTDSGAIAASYSYDHPTGQLTRVEYSDGTKRDFSYDQHGNLTADTISNASQTYSYSASGDLTAVSGAGTPSPLEIGYYDSGLISRLSEPQGLITIFQYDQTGRLTQTTFSDGMASPTTYDALGFRQDIQYMADDNVQYSYESSGNLLRIQIANKNGTKGGQTIETDEDYHVRKQVLASGLVVLFDYDLNGNLISETHNSKTTRFEYDALDRITAAVTPDGQRLEYQYAPGEPSLVTQADLRTGVVPSTRRDTGLTFASYGEVYATRTEVSQFG